jgi:hypothetical protein
MPNPTLYFT